MFDYNRGYAPDIEASGIMDIFRLPKFAFYFYQSQADIIENQLNDFNKPMIYIANYYNDPSFPEIKIFSNCDEVELLLNGKSIEKRKPDTDRNSTNLAHPPFTFKLKDFIPGKLEAVGYIKGKEAVRTQQQTPSNASGIKLWIDESGKKLAKGCNDIVFLYAAIVDQKGTIIPEAKNRVNFLIEGDAISVGNNPSEAGKIKVSATCDGLKSTDLLLNIE
jgi:beta-galactosidase